MICKDCRPVFETSILGPCNEWNRVLKHVELCPRHTELEATTTAEGALLALAEEEQAERRRYALGQMAAKNLPQLMALAALVGNVDMAGKVYNDALTQTAAVVRDLLSKIEEQEERPEKREKEKS